ncbi:MAG: hypothetical protein B7Y51_04555 [Burkholderiales bacterium 28-67-8]|nr:MAG: hypothetical protein B7Y51_04555 [Burkholderiales bacterium 28-67-8]
MTDSKDAGSFFRKVAKFVANPTLEWSALSPGAPDSVENELDRAELKAMIERKRRNDFVRKREFDMLRKVRREGLTPEQLAALGDASPMGDSEIRMHEREVSPSSGMKAKIDAIERQMVGNSTIEALRRPSEFRSVPTEPMPLRQREPAAAASGNAPVPASRSPYAPDVPLTFKALESATSFGLPSGLASGPEVVHDPELDEAVIAFANADFALCEQSLMQLTQANGPRAQHAETWLALFDLHRATGEAVKFERLALVYAQQFGRSAPQWYSMPQQMAEAAGEDQSLRARIEGQVGWISPEWFDLEQVAALRSQTLQMPLPWVLDWSALKGIDTEAAARLSELFRLWMPQKLDMRWLHGDRLLQCLQEAAPNGVRDADPVFWMLRLDVLRLINRPDQFDEAAIDYCVTYEMSPPSWEPAQCRVRFGGSSGSTWSAATSAVSGLSTSFVESRLTEDGVAGPVWNVDLSGQLVGDISRLLEEMNAQLGTASMISVSCLKLIRVDFIAAGDLLNWVLARRAENRRVGFVDAHRLIALFFGAMGINENASIKVRTV